MSKDLLSYTTYSVDREKFRRAGTRNGSDFNILDTPGHKYFKIFFYFDNGDVEGYTNTSELGSSSGLLAPTWNLNVNEKDYYKYNSAWSYLKMNMEDERADMLKDFVTLLSNISSESPWYFSELAGLDQALDRKQVDSNNFVLDDVRKKITIKCLPDAFDDRIGTLLDLYRSITWSWISKREVLPSNLRKFDMGVMIFNTETLPWSEKNPKTGLTTDENTPVEEEVTYKTSYKYIEFHNCEIDYNSSKTPWSSIDNKVGIQPEYTIDISFDDCYESRFNELLLKQLGDLVRWDWDVNNPDADKFDKNFISTQRNRLNEMIRGKGPNFGADVLGAAKDFVLGVAKKIVLGNLFTFSLTKMGDQLSSLASGQVISTARAITEYVKDAEQRKSGGVQYADHIGDIHPETTPTKYVNKIGNLFRAETLKNNI